MGAPATRCATFKIMQHNLILAADRCGRNEMVWAMITMSLDWIKRRTRRRIVIGPRCRPDLAAMSRYDSRFNVTVRLCAVSPMRQQSQNLCTPPYRKRWGSGNGRKCTCGYREPMGYYCLCAVIKGRKMVMVVVVVDLL